MGIEQPSEGEWKLRHQTQSPEKIAMKEEAFDRAGRSFELRSGDVPDEALGRFLRDKELVRTIEHASYPTGEDQCESIAERIGLGAEEVRAVSDVLARRRSSPIH